MSTLNNEDTECEENKLENILEEVIIKITEGPSQTRKDKDGQISSHLAYINKKNSSASLIVKLHENSTTETMTLEAQTWEERLFDGVMIDTNASRGSTCGEIQ